MGALFLRLLSPSIFLSFAATRAGSNLFRRMYSNFFRHQIPNVTRNYSSSGPVGRPASSIVDCGPCTIAAIMTPQSSFRLLNLRQPHDPQFASCPGYREFARPSPVSRLSPSVTSHAVAHGGFYGLEGYRKRSSASPTDYARGAVRRSGHSPVVLYFVLAL